MSVQYWTLIPIDPTAKLNQMSDLGTLARIAHASPLLTCPRPQYLSTQDTQCQLTWERQAKQKKKLRPQKKLRRVGRVVRFNPLKLNHIEKGLDSMASHNSFIFNSLNVKYLE
jgi:hypothetical protein